MIDTCCASIFCPPVARFTSRINGLLLTMCGLAVALLFTPLVPAQSSGLATVSGAVTEAHGNLLPNAAVEIRDEATGTVTRTTTDQQGRFSASGLVAGKYAITISAPGFDVAIRNGVVLVAERDVELPVSLTVAGVTQLVTVEANASGSVAAHYAPMDGLLDATSARTVISSPFIEEFTSPLADYSEILQMAPGTFSVNSNGVGLGDSKTYFRGFADGLYDITFDGIPFEDTNSPTHHSWAFFPAEWIGGVDFDRSPGRASTIGPTPFGGSINLLSHQMPSERSIRGGVSYGSFNTLLTDFNLETGSFGGGAKKSNLLVDVHHMTSDGYQTLNYQTRNAGALKYQFKISDKSTLTGFAGVLWLDTNTPNTKGPTRAQIAQYGLNYLLQDTDPTAPNYFRYNHYHVPTDFEYVGYSTQLGHGWLLDIKPYTYSYYNAQYYTNTPPKTTGGLINDTGKVNCSTPVKGVLPCAVDKLNSYRKYGEVTTASYASRFGVFRTGMWYEWATTNRYQIPSDPLTKVDQVLPNFHEKFYTNSYQPFAEFSYQATPSLTLTGGFKYAYYNQNLTQYADNGKTVGNLGGLASVNHAAGYKSYLPSADANYRIKQNWSVYGQFATGSVIPPSNVFDVTGAAVSLLPKPTSAYTYQGGSVLKLKQVTVNGDVYYTHFGSGYTALPDPNCTGVCYLSSGDSVTKGFEGEANLYLTHGLSLYANGTAGTAKYVSSVVGGVANPNDGKWVANTPENTVALGLSYQQKYVDAGIFNKRVGSMWNDNGTFNQVIPIDPFNVTNLFFNYTVRNGSRLDQSKVRLSFNNLFDQHNFTTVTQAASGPNYVPGPADTLGILPGRSVVLSVTLGYSPKNR
jgi:iron complex outermembrane recepter protein